MQVTEFAGYYIELEIVSASSSRNIKKKTKKKNYNIHE